MGSIRRWPRPEAPPSLRDELGELRIAFQVRMHSERVHLVALSAELARAEGDPGIIYDDLAVRARRLQGGAEVLEFDEVAAAADSLEKAAYRAAALHTDNADTSVWNALVALVSVMGSYDAR